jgi:hypothetical protein
MRSRSRRTLCWVVLGLIVTPGCGSDEVNSPTAVKLRGLANLYLDYAVARNGQGPAGEQAFRKHIRGMPDFVVKNNGLDPDSLDSAFVSQRDQEPFVVRYGTRITDLRGDSRQVIAHEKSGKNGKRLVVYASTRVDLVDEARLQELTSASK